MTRLRIIFLILSMALIAQACLPAQTQPNESVEETQTVAEDAPIPTAIATEAPLPTPTIAPTTEPTVTPAPRVRVQAIGGNLYIRRGPSTLYDRIGLLKRGEQAEVIGTDVLSKWVQVKIPGTEQTGWVSILTEYSQIDGDLSQVDSFTFTDFPLPAYIENCTEHDLLVLPNELYLYSLYTNSTYLNEVQVDPGVYTIKDLFVEGEPVYLTVDVREGQTVYITENALDETHLCGAVN
jgi:hypothetical protein